MPSSSAPGDVRAACLDPAQQLRTRERITPVLASHLRLLLGREILEILRVFPPFHSVFREP